MGKPRPLPKSGLKPAPKESGPKSGPKESGPKESGPKEAPAKSVARAATKAKPADARSAPLANGKPKKPGANSELRTSASAGLPPVQVRPAQPEVVIPEPPPPLPSPIASFTF